MVIGGCGGGAGQHPTSPVSGKVTLNGAPVDGATVTFVRDGGGKPAVGKTDASGSYKLTTYSKDDGAIVGSYKVTIAKWEAAAEDPAATRGTTGGGGDAYPEDYDPDAAGSDKESVNLLPAKYANFSSSGFTFTVAEGPNTADWALTAEEAPASTE